MVSVDHHIWGWVKTLVPSEPQNSWYMDVHPTKNVSIGIDPYPFSFYMLIHVGISTMDDK